MRRFATGEAIAWRSLDPPGRVVGYTHACLVVRDAPDLVVLYVPAGSVRTVRTGERGGPRGRFLLRWDGGYREDVWTGTNVLVRYRPGDAHSVWLAREAATGEPAWWYVNLEEPWRRTAIGFDSRDHWLDLWAKPDRREWHWKDEDELAWALAHGFLDAGAAAAIRAEGERALARVRRWEPPLDDGWETWRPAPEWRAAALPRGWDRVDLDAG